VEDGSDRRGTGRDMTLISCGRVLYPACLLSWHLKRLGLDEGNSARSPYIHCESRKQHLGTGSSPPLVLTYPVHRECQMTPARCMI